MTKGIYLLFFVIVTSCGQTNPSDKGPSATDSLNKINRESAVPLSNKSVKFLWRERRYDEELKDTFSTIIINEELSGKLSEPERAALGFVATFVGSECNWDGEAKEDFSNLKCKVLASLDLGYQCSEKHLGFLRRWFKNDKESQAELENCPTVPYTASSQTTFDHINLKVEGKEISVEFGANGVNMPMGETWNYIETDHFIFDTDNIRLNKKDQSKIKRGHFDTDK